MFFYDELVSYGLIYCLKYSNAILNFADETVFIYQSNIESIANDHLITSFLMLVM